MYDIAKGMQGIVDTYNTAKVGSLARLAYEQPQQRKSALAEMYGIDPNSANTMRKEFDEQDKADLANFSRTILGVYQKDPNTAKSMYQSGVGRWGDKFRAMGVEPPQDVSQALPFFEQMAGGGQAKARSAHILEDGTIAYMDEYGRLVRTGEKASNNFRPLIGANGEVTGFDPRGNTATPTMLGTPGAPQVAPPPAGSGRNTIVTPQDVQGAAQRTGDIMQQVRGEIAQLVANGMSVDQATSQVVKKYADARNLQMPQGGQPATSQQAPVPQAPMGGGQARVSVAPKKVVRDLTAQEIAARGLPVGTVAQIDESTGAIDIKSKPENTKPSLSDEAGIRKEYAAQSKPFVDVIGAYKRVEGAASNPTAAGDLSLIFAYMKMLDPGSVVREGEFANAQNAAGVPDQIRNLWNRAQRGERLNPAQRADFLNQARILRDEAQSSINTLSTQFTDIATAAGIDPTKVIVGPISGGKTTPPPKAGVIVNGYRFKGGNPADRNAWEKVN